MNPTPKHAERYGDSSAPYAAWQLMATGRVLWTFHDEDMAMQFCINNSLTLIRNEINH